MTVTADDGKDRAGLTLKAIRLSKMTPEQRSLLIERYERDVYGAAFTDASIREDPSYWLHLLNAADYPPPPQPLIDVVLLLDENQAVTAGVTIEFYRTAGCGLLTYISVAPFWRGRGLGRRLVRTARETLNRMAGPDTLMFAETERLEDAHDAAEREATILRQRQLAGLGARWVQFDYVMPPLRAGSEPHRLHLMVFDPEAELSTIPAHQIAELMRELAAALGANLAASGDTQAMMDFLGQRDCLPVTALPVVAADE